MQFWVINVTWSEGSGEQTGVLSVIVPPDEWTQLTKSGLLVFDTEEDARHFIDERHPGFGYKSAPLGHGAIAETVNSEHESTPDCIFYIGAYQIRERRAYKRAESG